MVVSLISTLYVASRNEFPDEKGIGTVKNARSRAGDLGRNEFPDEKGIDTRLHHWTARCCLRVEMSSPMRRGLTHIGTVARINNNSCGRNEFHDEKGIDTAPLRPRRDILRPVEMSLCKKT